MRISDWSSDVCSSDLDRRPSEHRRACLQSLAAADAGGAVLRVHRGARPRQPAHAQQAADRRQPCRHPRRSEEHTSELQSLMRISYAVFCLKKKKTTQAVQTNIRTQHYTLRHITKNTT